jgi:hypothetical protein
MKPRSVSAGTILLFVSGILFPLKAFDVPDLRSSRDGSYFVVVTEDGGFHGFDSCGDSSWVSYFGRSLINATDFSTTGAFSGPRMVPAIDGSLYVVFPPDLTSTSVRIAHVNATIMSVVAESPFSTPAFPNTYLTGSKIQSVNFIDFSDSFRGWVGSRRSSFLHGRRLVYSVNDWTLRSIDITTQREQWAVSFAEFPSLTQAHLIEGSFEQRIVASLGAQLDLSTSAVANKVILKWRPSSCMNTSQRELNFSSQVLGVYALLSPPDGQQNVMMVLVAKNAPIPTVFGGIPEGIFFNQLASQRVSSLPGVRVAYLTNSGDHAVPGETSFPLAIRPRTYEVTPWATDMPEVASFYTERVLSEFKVIDFLGYKFSQLSGHMKLYVIIVTFLALYLGRRFYRWISSKFSIRNRNSPSISILLPDGTALRQTLLPGADGGSTISISSPTSTASGARLVLIPSEATQPYEVVKVGQSDSVEFGSWQKEGDIEAFDKKIRDICQRTAKLPFAHSAASRRPSLDTGNATVLFLGRNVDEPKLVFRNPRAESELQRPNIPIYTQSIRNAVASSALRESSLLRAYIPRAVCGTWNTFEGVFQEYVPKPKAASSSTVSVQSLKEVPESAVDTAVLVLLLRDTDAHDGNYTRDLRRKIALFDLGCALADRPLPNDAVDRLALDNFEIWKRVPYLLNVPFDSRHIEYMESIDFLSLRNMWAQYAYQDQLVEVARLSNSRLVHPTVMLRVLEMHAKFLLACARAGHTVLFAAEVMYSGMYDDLWLEVGEENIDELEKRLIRLATVRTQTELFPHIEKLTMPPSLQADGELSPSAE